MNSSKATRWDPCGASLLLASAACLLPFLLPRHFPPLRTFYDEWIALALGVGAIGFAAAARIMPARVPALAVWLGAFSLFLVVRALAAPAAYPQGALLWSAYIFHAALLVTLGHALTMHYGRDRVCDMLAGFLLAGAVLNATSGVLQVVGIPRSIDEFVSYLHGSRAIGNVGQSNLYANYLALGEASLVYLYSGGRIGKKAALATGLLLLVGAALAASRSSVLYSMAFALLGWCVLRVPGDIPSRNLGRAAVVLAVAGGMAQWLVPLGFHALGFRIEGGFDRNASDYWDSTSDETASLRLHAWELAVKIFAGAPWIGEGPGEFAGAAFALGLPEKMASREIFTSPHNLVLQLLAETGLAGAFLAGAGLLGWARRTVPTFLRAPGRALWWVLACISVEMLHALLEYPFWYAHFLSLTALVMGVGAAGSMRIPPHAVRAALISGASMGAILLATNLRDYFRFEQAAPVYAGRSLGSDAEYRRDLDTLSQLRSGLLGPRAELWLFLALPLDPGTSARTLEIGNRVMRTWPTRDVVVRHSILLALAGREEEARTLFRKAVRTFTNRQAIRNAVASAPEPARAILQAEIPPVEHR